MTEKSFNVRPRDGKKNSPIFLYLVRAVCVSLLWHDRRQADNPFPHILSVAGHGRCLSWQRWFFFLAQADSVVQAVEIQSRWHIPTRKKRVALDHAILVVTETALRLFVLSLDPALRQILTEVAADEVVVMWRSPILLVNEVNTVIFILRQ